MTVSYTLGQLTDDVFQQLRGTMRDRVNQIAVTLDAPAALTIETITLSTSILGVVQGSLLSVGDETMYVLDTNSTAKQAQVMRGYDDTTPVASPAGTLVWVDAPWPRKMVQERIRDEIRSWAPQVFQIGSYDTPAVSWQRGYDFPANGDTVIRVLLVTAPQPPYTGSPGAWDLPPTNNITQDNPSFPFSYDPNANPVEFASGRSITLTGASLPPVGWNLHIVYAKPFDVDTSWTDATDMIANVGMDSRDLDIPPLGVSARLLRMMSVRRAMLNVQGQASDSQDVTMQAILQAAQQFKVDTQTRLSDVQLRLLSDWPMRSSNF